MSLWRDKFKNRENGSEATATPAPEAEASAAEATPVSIPTPVPTPTLGASPAAPATSSGPMPFPVFSTPLAEEPAKEPAEDPVEEPAPAPEPPAAEPAPADPDPEPTPVEPAPKPEPKPASEPAPTPALPAPAATDLDFIQTVLDYRAAGCPVLKFEDHDVDFAYRVSLPSGPRYMPVEDLAKVKEADLSVVHAGYYTSETGFRPLPAADSEYYKKLWLAGHGKTSKKIW